MLVLSSPGAVCLMPLSRSESREHLDTMMGADLISPYDRNSEHGQEHPHRVGDLEHASRGGPIPGLPGLNLLTEELDVERAERSPHGTGGVYFIPNKEDTRRVVFKPQDEENSTTAGDGFVKEYAAYVVDGGLAGVPETTVSLVDLGKGTQIGSLQAFVDDSEDAEDFGPGVFNVEDVHRIGVLDIRILNCDRHSGNLMRNKRTGKLVPIDHGSSFPCAFSGQLGNFSVEWLLYPQARKPFSPELLEEIEAIDLEFDLEKLHATGLDEGAQLSSWMSTTLLKLGARAGLTLYDIGRLIQREGDRSSPSALELLFSTAVAECKSPDRSDFFRVFSLLAAEKVASMAE